jgi:hypothetical protein
MALPRLTIRLFPPKRGGTAYSSSGHLVIPLGDVHALAEWLLGQAGEYDEYLQQNVVRLQAYEFQNTSKGGNSYRTVQLKDPADRPGSGLQATASLALSAGEPSLGGSSDASCSATGDIPF